MKEICCSKDKVLKTGYFHLARLAARSSNHKDYHIGAVISNKHPISHGHNIVRTHPIFADGKRWYTIHAEMHAILCAETIEIPGCSVYVYRETANGDLALAKPCDECLAVLIEVGIKNIFYTTPDGYVRVNL